MGNVLWLETKMKALWVVKEPTEDEILDGHFQGWVDGCQAVGSGVGTEQGQFRPREQDEKR